MKLSLTTLHLSIFAAALASAQLASAATMVLTPTDDSLIRAIQVNQGNNNLVLVGDTTTANDFLRGAFAFDLSSPLLTGATINSATLTLTIDNVDLPSENATVTINLHQLTASFTNNGVTWTSRDGINNWTTPGGDFGGVLASDTANAFTVGPGDTVDFTSAAFASAAQSAIGGSIFLLAKLDVEDTTQRNIFRFKASNLATGKPTLTINFTPIPEPSTALLLGLGFLSLLRRRRR